MANVKYLSLEGLERTIAHIHLKFGAGLSSSASATNYTVSLLNRDITPGVLATAVINAATTTSAGVMSNTDKSNLDDLVTNGIKTINSGTGITVTKSGNTATVSLNAANTTTIGGIKVGSVGTAASGANTTLNANKFAVHIDSNGLGYVAIPAYSNNSGDITAVVAGDGLIGGANSGSATLNVGAGEGISVTADAVAIKTATNTTLGGIKTGYAGTTAKTYAVKVDSSGNAYVSVDWQNDNSKLTTVDYTATTQTDSTANTIAVVTEVGDATGTNGLSVSGTYKTQNVYTKTYVDAVKTRVTDLETRLSTAMRYIGKTSTGLSDGSTTNTITINTKTVTAAQGDVVIDNNDKKEYIWNGSKWEEFGNEGNYKTKQNKVLDPTANGSASAFIDSITQDENGVITVTKKNVPVLSTGTEDSMATDAIVLGGITVNGHTITAQTKTIVAGNNITIGTTTAGKIYITGTADTKVTSAANHYTPSENTASQLNASGAGNNDITNIANGVQVVTGLKRDAKGHVVGVVSAALKSTNTDTKVTAVENHYTPTTANNITITGTLSATANPYVFNTEYTVLTGVSVQKDAAGHITGVNYTAQKVKDTNTDTKVTSVANHYEPSENASSQLNASGANATDIANGTGVQVVTGLKRDAKGHVVGVVSASLKSTNTTYTVSAPISMSNNKISLSYATGSTSTMLKASGTTATTFADTTASTATIVTHNKLGLVNNALCAEIDTITAYEIDALFS